MTRKYGQGLVKTSLYFTPEILTELAKMPKGQASEFVRQAVEEKLRNDIRRCALNEAIDHDKEMRQ